jgi:hypothetical protein
LSSALLAKLLYSTNNHSWQLGFDDAAIAVSTSSKLLKSYTPSLGETSFHVRRKLMPVTPGCSHSAAAPAGVSA